MTGRIIEIEQSAAGLRWHKVEPAWLAYQMPSAPETGPTRRQESMMRKLLVIAATAATLVMAGNAVAAEVEVKLLNRGAEGVMVFEPALVKIAPGDSVKFVAADKGHNAESIKGMLPEGATPFVGKNSEDTTVKFDQEGVYGVKCMPHYGMGMVAMIVVGNPANEDQAKAIPQTGRAKQVFATLFGRLDASKAAAK
jgi:pseudoazurin